MRKNDDLPPDLRERDPQRPVLEDLPLEEPAEAIAPPEDPRPDGPPEPFLRRS